MGVDQDLGLRAAEAWASTVARAAGHKAQTRAEIRPAMLVQDACESGNGRLAVSTEGAASNRDSIGARVTVSAQVSMPRQSLPTWLKRW